MPRAAACTSGRPGRWPARAWRLGRRAVSLGAALGLVLAMAVAMSGCGGGGGAGPTDAPSGSSTSTVMGATIHSIHTDTTYPLCIYLPAASAGPRAKLPVIYVLDGESWFQTLAGIVEGAHAAVIIVAVQSAGQRNRDFVPDNTCTPHGGGQARFLDFLRRELVSYVESNVGGDPARRILFGHSHGGSFALYALFAEPPVGHTFRTVLASDASISCMPAAVLGWERAYATAFTALPVRLHLSCATQGNCAANLEFAPVLAARQHAGLVLQVQPYAGSHSGIVPQVLADGLAFALAGGPAPAGWQHPAVAPRIGAWTCTSSAETPTPAGPRWCGH